jgi:signal transduction histidine kinase/CheY-like chemotaxis protein
MKAARTIAPSTAPGQSSSGSFDHAARVNPSASPDSQRHPGPLQISPRDPLSVEPLAIGLPSLESASAAFDVLFDSSGEALLILDRAGIIQRLNNRARGIIRLKDAPSSGSLLRKALCDPLDPDPCEAHGAGTRLDDLILDPAPSVLASLLGLRLSASPAGSHAAVIASIARDRSIRLTLRAVLPVTQHLLICLEASSPAQSPGTKNSGASIAAAQINPAQNTPAQNFPEQMVQTEKMAALGQLVSGIAHELNNPLTAIMGYAQLLLGHGLKPHQLVEAKRVFQEAERACHIVKNLLYFARANQTEQTAVSLNEVIGRALALRSYELKIENIHVQCDLAPSLPQTMADPLQLQQVVLNLIINAEQALLEYRGHGNVRIRTSHVLRGPQQSVHILLEVADDGPGILPEHASRIFEPFFTTKPPGAGTGLGLSITYGIVHQHGGEVTFESQPGSGTRFIVDLPVVPIPVPSANVLPTVFSEPAMNVRGRILIVEDEPSVAQLMVDVLQEEGHQAESVLNSQEGLTLISRHTYDLIVCDLRMPQIDGQAFYDALVSAGSSMSHRVIIVTGDVLAARTREFLERTRLPFLAKPFLVEELKLAVARLLSSASKPAGALAERSDSRAPVELHAKL